MELIERENVDIELQAKDLQHQVDLLVQKNKDLEDEVLTKDQKIYDLAETVEKLKEKEINLKSSASHSLDKEMNPLNKEELELINVVKDLEMEIEKMKTNEATKQKQRMALMHRERMVFESNKLDLDSLKQSIVKLKTNKRSFPRCYYGIKCRKMFCQFDHSHVFRKDNRKESSFERSPSNIESDLEFLCDHCGKVCESRIDFSIHVKRKHEGASELLPNYLKCNICNETFAKQNVLEMHVRNCHREIQCTICEDMFANEDELDDHRERVHTKVDLQQCVVGEIRFKNKNMLRNDIEAKHESHKNIDNEEEMSEYLVSESGSEASSISPEESSDIENSETESGRSTS